MLDCISLNRDKSCRENLERVDEWMRKKEMKTHKDLDICKGGANTKQPNNSSTHLLTNSSTDSEVVIKVEHVSKKYCKSLKRSMWYGVKDIGRNIFGKSSHSDKLRKNEFWALDDVSFELRKGETLGIVGSNGSGKTTLLKLLNGIFWPDKGKITIRGKVGALIAIGSGFHPLLTGRENIYINGAILGMSKKEMDEKFDAIIKFANIGDFIDVPVKFYSSGMFVRLGFAIAVHCEPNILLVDEVLAVGDLDFALKCHRKMADFRLNGGTTILVSHNLQVIKNICNRAIWLNEGIIKSVGEVNNTIEAYERYVNLSRNITFGMNRVRTDNYAEINEVEFINKTGERVKEYNFGESLILKIYYQTKRIVKKPIFTVSIFDIKDTLVTSNYSNWDGLNLDEIKGKGFIEYRIDKINLSPGKYFCSVTLAEIEVSNPLDWHEKCYAFMVSGKSNNYGFFNPFPKWIHRRA